MHGDFQRAFAHSERARGCGLIAVISVTGEPGFQARELICFAGIGPFLFQFGERTIENRERPLAVEEFIQRERMCMARIKPGDVSVPASSGTETDPPPRFSRGCVRQVQQKEWVMVGTGATKQPEPQRKP